MAYVYAAYVLPFLVLLPSLKLYRVTCSYSACPFYAFLSLPKAFSFKLCQVGESSFFWFVTRMCAWLLPQLCLSWIVQDISCLATLSLIPMRLGNGAICDVSYYHGTSDCLAVADIEARDQQIILLKSKWVLDVGCLVNSSCELFGQYSIWMAVLIAWFPGSPWVGGRGWEPGNEVVYYLKHSLFFCSLAECQSSEQEKTAQNKALEVWCPTQYQCWMWSMLSHVIRCVLHTVETSTVPCRVWESSQSLQKPWGVCVYSVVDTSDLL